MLINTFSIVIGTAACDAKCPYCVSRQTGLGPVQVEHRVLSRHQNFTAALKMAEISKTTTLLFTGKGEPTLFPDDITHFLGATAASSIAFKELQTNGISIGRAIQSDGSGERNARMMRKHLPAWSTGGLNTIALSVVGVHDEQNARIFNPKYPPLADTVRYLRRNGFTIRLSVMMLKGFVDSPDALTEVVDWAREHDVAQVTARPIRSAWNPEDNNASAFVAKHGLPRHQEQVITEYVEENSSPSRLRLSHGAIIYNFRGRNLCLTDCLTTPNTTDHIRTLIYYANTHQINYDWYEGTVLLSGTAQQ